MTERAYDFTHVVNISTHILTKRMTGFLPVLWWHGIISTHILTKRMTFSLSSTVSSNDAFQLTSSRRGWHALEHYSQHFSKNFNSHPHEEDDFISTPFSGGNYISTHILTKRMTTRIFVQIRILRFQLTSSRRGWLFYFSYIFGIFIFQLTSSRRGWRTSHSAVAGAFLFQLTSSRRGWPRRCLEWHGSRHISTHILTKRMTVCIWKFYFTTIISTHILTKRMTVRVALMLRPIGHFNSHPHEEDDCTHGIRPHRGKLFQLTSSRRGWLHYSNHLLSK